MGQYEPIFLYFNPFYEKKITFRSLEDLMAVLDYLLGVMGHGAELTHLDVIGCGTDVPVALAVKADTASTWP